MDNIPGGFSEPGPGDRGAAQQQVNTPAILLMVTGGLGIASGLFGLIQSLMGRGAALPPELYNDPNMAQFRGMIETLQSGGWVFNLIGLALCGLIFFGGLKMKNLENFGLAIAASIIAIIPCFSGCCCIIGMPAGIWALVVLNKPEVKAAFR
ncbi:hypothetical protein [Archangium sp.]|uniref:hypothetical protein n=1 Tax=Archangium sp. TaxID=1872627 RepID=UPI00286BBB60|nr:hypothetical protein [Archangium sp.]